MYKNGAGSFANIKTKSTINFLFAVIFIAVTFPIWKSLISFWSSSDDYSHGFFILPISGYIIWQKREGLRKMPIAPSLWGLVVIVVSLSIYVISTYAEIYTLKVFSVIPMLMGVIIYLYGFKIFYELLFPLCFLVFMIPVPSQIYSALTIPLQLFVSKISTDISFLSGITIYREGNVIHLPDQTFQVVQACSGLRSLISLLTLSTVFGYLTLSSNILRGLLILSAVPVAIIVNIVRVLVTIIAFEFWGVNLTTGSVHTTFGMFIFMLALIIIAVLRKILSIWDNSITKEVYS